eukprot:Pgem_evm1s4706
MGSENPTININIIACEIGISSKSNVDPIVSNNNRIRRKPKVNSSSSLGALNNFKMKKSTSNCELSEATNFINQDQNHNPE